MGKKRNYQKVTPEEEARKAERQRRVRERIAEREAIDRAVDVQLLRVSRLRHSHVARRTHDKLGGIDRSEQRASVNAVLEAGDAAGVASADEPVAQLLDELFRHLIVGVERQDVRRRHAG